MKKVKMLLVVVALIVTIGMNAENNAVNSLVPSPSVKILALNGRSNTENFKLDHVNGKYVLLQFWAKRAEGSLKKCIELDHTVRNSRSKKIEMVMISFDPLFYTYDELLKSSKSTAELAKNDVYSETYQEYCADKTLANYLLDENGVIVARNVNPDELAMYIKQIK